MNGIGINIKPSAGGTFTLKYCLSFIHQANYTKYFFSAPREKRPAPFQREPLSLLLSLYASGTELHAAETLDRNFSAKLLADFGEILLNRLICVCDVILLEKADLRAVLGGHTLLDAD